jgi:ribosomal protein S18 acetylase RimI-like enzyme
MDGRTITIERFHEGQLAAMLELSAEVGWRRLTDDPDRAAAAFAAPGVVTLVALLDGDLAGFAQTLTDGHIQAFLACLVVSESARRRGIGRALLEASLAESGALRIDLLAAHGSGSFYASFAPEEWSGIRIHGPEPR